MDQERVLPSDVGTTSTDAGVLTSGLEQEVEIGIQELYPSFDAAAVESFVQGAVETQQKKSGSMRLAALVGALVLFAAAAGGLVFAKGLKTKLRYEPAHLQQYAEEASKNIDEVVRIWAASSPAVRNMFCTNYFPRARGLEVVSDPVPAFQKELEACKALAMPTEEGERKERALHLKFLNAVASAARARLLGLQAVEAYVKKAPAGIFPEDGDSVDLVRYREFQNLLFNLRKVEGQEAKPFPKELVNELEIASSFRFLRDEYDRLAFSTFEEFLQLVDKTKAFVIPGGDKEGKEESVSTFRMLPYPYFFPTQMFKGLLTQFKDLNTKRSMPFKRPEDFKVPESMAAALNLLKEADGGAAEGSFRAIKHKDSFVAQWRALAETPADQFDLVQLGVYLL
ncbi:hypothetical protein Emed_006853 [Eimeria media]